MPDNAPDSIPTAIWQELYDDRNLSYTVSGYGPLPRNLIRVTFRPETSQDTKQKALKAIEAEVVGGGGGEYALRIHEDGTLRPLNRAISTLEQHPSVQSAGPDFTLTLQGSSNLIQYRCRQ